MAKTDNMPVLLKNPDGSLRQTNKLTDEDWQRIREGSLILIFFTECQGGGFAEFVPSGGVMPKWRMIPGSTKDGSKMPEM